LRELHDDPDIPVVFDARNCVLQVVPVCVVPFGRDQYEVARRVEVARCGTRLPAKKLTPTRLRAKVREAMTMTDGARRVTAGFVATGGVARGGDLIEQRVL
jgi:UDP:flavonoid glycosyltransferase YjiC (YdhE family)